MVNKKVQILKKDGNEDNNLIIGLFTTYDDLGIMSGFDGNILNEENFNITHETDTNSNKLILHFNINSNFKKDIISLHVEWGDGEVDTEFNLETRIHRYNTTIDVNIIIVITTTYGTYFYHREINGDSPFNPTFIPNDPNFGSPENRIPTTGGINLNFIGIGQSRLEELKRYGEDSYNGVTYGSVDGINFIQYIIDGLTYVDYEDGMTKITGNTGQFTMEETINEMLTRNEHFLGFVEEPTIQSDIFVDRGKQGVIEKSLRLCEIDNVGELTIYGNGYFKLKKQ